MSRPEIAWIDKPDEPGEAVVWLLRLAALPPLAPARSEDMIDSAHGGGPGRLTRRRVARTLLAARNGRHPDTVKLDRTVEGGLKPALESDGFISISERHGWIAVAHARQMIGVDIERAGDAETSELDAMAPASEDLDFGLRWAALEAFSKLMGTGLIPELERTRLAFTPPDHLVASLGERKAGLRFRRVGEIFAAAALDIN